ncbi:MAG: sigma-70 family RNA polymerase sigma factor [Flavobacteriaceae bacterium]
MNLEELVQRFQTKDVAAFERLHSMYADNICGVINTIVRNDALAQEVCQDVFIKVWNNAENYNSSKGRFFTWILNIARNAAIDEVRSKSYKNSKKNLSADYFVGILDHNNAAESKIDAIGLKKLVTNLKDKCIQIINLLYFKGYTQKEAAEELNIPVGTIKTRNRSCISQLRENLKL